MPEAAQRSSLLPTPPTGTTAVGTRRLGEEETQGSGEPRAQDGRGFRQEAQLQWLLGTSHTVTMWHGGQGGLPASAHISLYIQDRCRELIPTRAPWGQDDEGTDVTEAL